MNQKPTCPKCRETEFTSEPIPMPNTGCWNPVICKACGVIVGQLPSNDELEGLKRLGKLATFEEQLEVIKSLLLAFEKQFLKKPN